MTVLAELSADFPWGVLLVTDPSSTEQIPQWSSPDEVVTTAVSALVMRVRHADEGPVTVRVLDNQLGSRGELVFEGTLQLVSGELKVSDALGTEAITVGVGVGTASVHIFADAPSEASVIDLVVEQ